MKLRMDEFKELARRKCHTNGFLLWRKIWGGQSAYSLVSKGIGVGYEVLKNLRQINLNINQIAAKANSIGFIDTAEYWKNVEWLQREISELKTEVMT